MIINADDTVYTLNIRPKKSLGFPYNVKLTSKITESRNTEVKYISIIVRSVSNLEVQFIYGH